MMEWIKTSTNLPENKGNYLFWIENDKIPLILFYDPEYIVLFDPKTYKMKYLLDEASNWLEIETPKNATNDTNRN